MLAIAAVYRRTTLMRAAAKISRWGTASCGLVHVVPFRKLSRSGSYRVRRRPSRLTLLLSSSNLLLDVTDTQNGFPQGLKIIVKIVIEIEMSFLDGLEEFPL